MSWRIVMFLRRTMSVLWSIRNSSTQKQNPPLLVIHRSQAHLSNRFHRQIPDWASTTEKNTTEGMNTLNISHGYKEKKLSYRNWQFSKINYFVYTVSKAVHHMVIKDLLLSHIFIYLCIIFHLIPIHTLVLSINKEAYYKTDGSNGHLFEMTDRPRGWLDLRPQ